MWWLTFLCSFPYSLSRSRPENIHGGRRGLSSQSHSRDSNGRNRTEIPDPPTGGRTNRRNKVSVCAPNQFSSSSVNDLLRRPFRGPVTGQDSPEDPPDTGHYSYPRTIYGRSSRGHSSEVVNDFPSRYRTLFPSGFDDRDEGDRGPERVFRELVPSHPLYCTAR